MTEREFITTMKNVLALAEASLENSGTQTTQQETKPKPQEVKPTSTEPEIINAGKSEYVLTPGEQAKFSVFVNNVSSSRDYSVESAGDPTFFSCDEVGNKTKYGYRLDFVLKGKIAGKGTIKIYITKKRDVFTTINVIIKN